MAKMNVTKNDRESTSQDKPPYETPVVMLLGSLVRGQGQGCENGSNPGGGGCITGGNASGGCTDGGLLAGLCSTGTTPTGNCMEGTYR